MKEIMQKYKKLKKLKFYMRKYPLNAKESSKMRNRVTKKAWGIQKTKK